MKKELKRITAFSMALIMLTGLFSVTIAEDIPGNETIVIGEAEITDYVTINVTDDVTATESIPAVEEEDIPTVEAEPEEVTAPVITMETNEESVDEL